MVDFPEKNKQQWNEWGIRCLVLSSISLQIFLTFAEPLRRRKTSIRVRPFIWAAYLLADWVAALALQKLSSNVYSIPECKNGHCTNTVNANELVAFWAPFLLVHLGGPDTITALALEDNQLWLRHLAQLLIYLIGAIYIFMLTLPNNPLLIPTLMIFMVGIVRCIERTKALYLASSSRFRLSMPTKNPSLNDLPIRNPMGKKPEEATGNEPNQRIDSIEAVQSAHRFLATYKCLIVDRLLRFDEREESRSYFLNLLPEDAFGIIQIELGLLFDMLYTKAMVIHNRIGYLLRAICFSFILAALVIFISFDKRGSHRMDSFITYALLIGAMLLDVVGFVNLIFSNWMVAFLRNPLARRLTSKMSAQVIPYGPPRQPAYMSQYNLMSYWLRSCSTSRKMAERLGIVDFVELLAFTQDVPILADLKAFIYDHLLLKSRDTNSLDDINHMCKNRWNWAIREEGLPHWFFSLEWEESILLWHITTDLCYHLREDKVPHRNFSKVLSDYMHYLLFMHPTMISSTEGIPQIKWQDVCQEAMGFIQQDHLKDKESLCQKLIEKYSLTDYCSPQMQRTGTLLKDACLIAKNLLSKPELFTWMDISKVWVELLSSAANHCSGKYHAQRLVKGGEFLTSIWLLMAHFGLSERYRDFSHSQAGPPGFLHTMV